MSKVRVLWSLFFGIQLLLTVGATAQDTSLVVKRVLSEQALKAGDAVESLRYALEWMSEVAVDNHPDYRKVNVHIGDIYFSEKIYSAALNYYLKALGSFQEDKVNLVLLKKLGNTYFENHQVDSALIFYQKELLFHQEMEDFKGQLQCWHRMAKAHEINGSCQSALEYYQLILAKVIAAKETNELPTVHNNIGYQYHCLGDKKNALKYFKKAWDDCIGDCNINQVTLAKNIGIAFFNDQQYQLSNDFFEKSLILAKKRNDWKEVGTIQHLIAISYYEQNELFEALHANGEAMNTLKQAVAPTLLKAAYLTEANIYERLYEYDKALGFYQKHLGLRDSLLLQEGLRKEKLLQHQFSLTQKEKEVKLLIINQKVQDLAFDQLQLEKDKLELHTNNLNLVAERKEKELILLRRDQEIRDEKLRFEALQTLRAKQELSLTKERLSVADKDKEILGFQEKAALHALEIAKKEAIEKDRAQEILTLNNDKKLQLVELEKQAGFRQFVFWILGALGVILILILYGYLFARRTNKQLEKKNIEIEAQKSQIESANEKSEQLLLNILPEQTALELMNKGYAEPRYYKKVTVLFADFQNFTKLSEKMSPSVLIEELNICFSAFDDIITNLGLEKIKTIGDAYMCAAGLPVENETHAENTIDAAIEMMNFIQNRVDSKSKQDEVYWKMRIGIHSGPVVAGVVGSRKFAYDIWGDTVNVASRMESNSEPGKINISKATRLLLSNKYHIENRGSLPVKNKGDMEMFFVKK